MRLCTGTAEHLNKVLEENIELWGQGFDLAGYITYHNKLREHPWSLENYRHLVLLDWDDSVLSSCKVYKLRGWFKGRSLKLAEIGAVYTPKVQRSQGYARVMLGLLLARLKAEGTDLAVLFSDIPPEFYSNLGFRQIKKRDLIFDLKAPLKPGREVITAAGKVPSEVISLYRENGSEDFKIGRNPRYWDMLSFKKHLYNSLQSRMSCLEELHFCQDGSAYAWTLWNGRKLQVKDMGCESPDALADIFSVLAQKHGRGVLCHVYGWLPHRFDGFDHFSFSRRITRSISVLMIADLSGENQDIFQANPDQIHMWSLDYF